MMDQDVKRTDGGQPGPELAGQVAFVTGGAAGIGLAIARKLGERGARLALFDRDAAGRRGRGRGAAGRTGSRRCRWRWTSPTRPRSREPSSRRWARSDAWTSW